MKAEIYIDNTTVTAELLFKDTKTYIIPFLCFKILEGRHKGEKIAILENGDKFKQWIK